MLINLKFEDTLFDILGQLTKCRIVGGVCSQALLRLGTVGIDFCDGIVFVEIQLRMEKRSAKQIMKS